MAITALEVDQQELVEKLAEELKRIKTIQAPDWAAFVKTGMGKERPPAKEDWWYHRSASILKNVNKMGPIGVNKLRTKYGGKHRRGHKPPRFAVGSGNIIRKILQQLEKAGFVKSSDKGVHKGKIITPEGIKLLNRVATVVAASGPRKRKPKGEMKAAQPKALSKEIQKEAPMSQKEQPPQKERRDKSKDNREK